MNPVSMPMTFHCSDRECPESSYTIWGKSRAAIIRRAIGEGWRDIGGDAWLCPRCARRPTAEQSRDELLAACKGILAMRDAMAGKGSYSRLEQEAIAAVSTEEPTATQRIHIRWMIRRDMPEVLESERLGRPLDAWGESDFLDILRGRNVIGMVAEVHDAGPAAIRGARPVVGHMVYELYPQWLGVARFTVHPNWRRAGVGSALAAKLKGKLGGHRRTHLRASAPEYYGYAGPMFLRACGFVATGMAGDDRIDFIFRREWDRDRD